jgi:endonuclease/exonuclease/phosphatase family metal-dependent hydrolase
MSRPHQVTAAVALSLFAALSASQPKPDILRKPSIDAVRVLTWNVYRNSVFPPEGQVVDASGATRPAQFARVLRAVQPDVLCLQEITVSGERSAALVDQILPQQDGRTWQAHAAVDTVIVSRFNLGARGQGQVESGSLRRGHAIAVIQTPAADLFMICAHFQSSDRPEDVSMRLRQADVITRTVREAKIGGSAPALQSRTPFVILGDFNAIPGASTFVDAITNGNLAQNNGGASEGPDWDGSSLTDARPRHNGSGPEVYTWRNDLEPFPPGVLDRILYSDSVATSVNQFVLDTTAMSYDELVGHRLRSIDVMLDPQAGTHDHFPLVIDLSLRKRP